MDLHLNHKSLHLRMITRYVDTNTIILTPIYFIHTSLRYQFLLELRDTCFHHYWMEKELIFSNPRNRSNQLVHEGVGNILPLISDFIKDAFCFKRLH